MGTLLSVELLEAAPSRLWAALDAPTRALAARALYSGNGTQGPWRREADRAVAATLRFRDAAIVKLPLEKRIGHLARSVRPNDSLSSTLLLALHLAERRPLLAAFLDALSIPHEDGMIAESHELRAPDAARLRAAAAALFERFPPEQVELYLVSLLAMDPGSWGGLREVLRERLA